MALHRGNCRGEVYPDVKDPLNPNDHVGRVAKELRKFFTPDEDEEPICLYCHNPLPEGRRKFCSNEHAIRYYNGNRQATGPNPRR